KIFLTLARLRARLKQRSFGGEHRLDVTLGRARGYFGRNLQLRQAVALGGQSSDPRPGFIELLAHDLKAGLRLSWVEANQQIAGFHVSPIMDRDLRHDAASRMLDGLDVRLHDKIAGYHDRARERH